MRRAAGGLLGALCIGLAGGGLASGGLTGCALFRRAPAIVAHPHYQLGAGYRSGGTWYYPAESYAAVQTGLAAVDPAGRAAPRLTADGEVYSPQALAAAHQTLQLPAIARLTDLRTGRQIVVRLNDRGPASPARLLTVTPLVASLLALRAADPVRLEVLPEPSRVAVEAIGGGPRLTIAIAPREAIRAEPLPPAGLRRAATSHPAPPAADATSPPALSAAPGTAPALLPRLEPVVVQLPPLAVRLMLHLGDFTTAGPATLQASLVSGAAVSNARIGRSVAYSVDAGPYPDAATAEAALDQALRAGVTDARIVVQSCSLAGTAC